MKGRLQDIGDCRYCNDRHATSFAANAAPTILQFHNPAAAPADYFGWRIGSTMRKQEPSPTVLSRSMRP